MQTMIRLFAAAWHGLRVRVHIRHWRGRGIHSPFIYGVVRQVFMARQIVGNDPELYNALRRNGLGKKPATLLQNLFRYCESDTYILWKENTAGPTTGRNFHIVLPDSKPEIVVSAAARAAADSGILAVAGPRRSNAAKRAARQILHSYPCVSVDRIDLLLCFFDPKRQAQHYRI